MLNAVDLQIEDGRLTNGNGTKLDVSEISLDPPGERARVLLAEPAPPGEWTLHLEFTGVLNERLVGFYASTYTDTESRTRTIATTHFEATDARRAFPCWDEPDLKAVFSVTAPLSA